MFLRLFALKWSVVALVGLLISASCVDTTLDSSFNGEGRRETDPATSADQAGMTPQLRAAFIAAVQSDAGESYRATREASGAARFVHLSQGFEATIDGALVRLAPEDAGAWELSLSTVGVGCEGARELGLEAGPVEMSGNRVEIARGSVREWYVSGPLGLEQGFTLERAPSCEGTKVVTIEVGGSVAPELADEDGDGLGEAIAFVDVNDGPVARYTDLYVKDATGKRLNAWMSVAAGTLSLHVDDAGATYPVQIDPLIWVEQTNLLASDGAGSDAFGWAVAISGNTAIVGGRNDDIGANADQGSAYVFTRTGGVWTQQQKLTASDGAAGDTFGYSVALSGDTALVGAHRADVGANLEQGSAYVFTRTGGVWTQQQKLTASDGAVNDFFGVSVALSGDTALVGTLFGDGAISNQGAAYVFTRTGSVWTQQQKLTASDGAANDVFGVSVALSGDTALVGAYQNKVGSNALQGAAYVFTRTGAVWTQQQKLTSSDGAANDYFGVSVALSGDTALVGSYQSKVGLNALQGAAYVFTRAGAVWTQQQKLTASDGAASDNFGVSAALSGDTALVGAYQGDVGANSNQGSAYVFTRTGGVWTQQQKLTASDGAAGDDFGYSVALSVDTALVGSFFNDVGANADQGSAYVFAVFKTNGDACAQNAECLSGFCVDGVCCNTACGGGSPGDCQACSAAEGAAVTGTCGPRATGAACNDGDVCSQVDSCQSGVCVGSVPVVCAAMDQCHVAGTCDAATGVCSNPPVADGMACNDVNACSQTDSCQAGVCVGSNPVVCAAMDQCHVAGTCDAVTGACSNPPVADGTACNDGNACSQTDSCQAGVCVGSNPVVCAAMDQCHVAGICDAATGACTNPPVADGTACNDGNACSQTDSCQTGVCAGSNPVVCAASDQCHVAGTCNAVTGVCTNPPVADGTACDDGNACSQTDSCQAGVCAGSNPVLCAASDQCHVVGVCDPTTGACSNPAAADGTACNDGNACSQTDSCQAGVCTGSNPVVCAASDQCHVVGVCDPTTGACSNPAAANGTTCDDGDPCTQTDSCQAGACAGSNPVVCAASDQCHVAGVCDTTTGACSNPAAADGTACDDGDICTKADSCQAGVCASGTALDCDDQDACTIDSCDVASGCQHRTTCDAGTDGGSEGDPPVVVPSGEGCSCRVADAHDERAPSSQALALAALAALTLARRRRSPRA